MYIKSLNHWVFPVHECTQVGLIHRMPHGGKVDMERDTVRCFDVYTGKRLYTQNLTSSG